MELSDFYPSPQDLIESELSVLGYLRDNKYIQERQSHVAVDAARHLYSSKASRTGFEFHSHFDLWHAQIPGRKDKKTAGQGGSPAPNTRLFLSARIDAKGAKFANATYSLSVCRLPKQSILRKFHFDVVAGSRGGRRQGHPRCHLQYCGKMPGYMKSVGCRNEQLTPMYPWLSEPRIFFWPMSLALLIDMALREFPDQASANFRADSYWRRLVREQEALVLGPFYRKCADIIKEAQSRDQTLADAFYVS